MTDRRKIVRRREDVTARRKVIGAFVAVVAVAGLGLSAVGYLAHENGNRIDDIQAARVASCERTYEGIREVFTPFFPDPKTATPDQLADLAKFNRTIDELKGNCRVQTRVTLKEAS